MNTTQQQDGSVHQGVSDAAGPSAASEDAGVTNEAPFTLNKYLMSFRDENDPRTQEDRSFPLARRITCADGFSLSVQASHGAYCSPRRNIGPWSEVEVGFPSAVPELIMSYVESPECPTETVYGYVPIALVEELIALHGGPDAEALAAITKTGAA